MTSPDTVAVIIPTFNSARFIERALSSALQEHVSEIIVIDDASTDDTVEVVQREAQRNGMIRLIRQNVNRGPSAARNRGVAASTAAWLATLDADDAFQPGRISSLLKLAAEHEAELVSDNLTYYNAFTQTVLGPAVHPDPPVQRVTLEKLFRSTPDHGQDYVVLMPLIKSEFLRRHAIRYNEEIRNGEDFDLVAHCLVAGGSFVADLSMSTYLYTSRESGTSVAAISDNAAVRQAKAWLRHPAFSSSPERRQLVKDRVEILRRRELDRHAGGATGSQRLAILVRALQSPAGRRWAINWSLARLRRLAGEAIGGR